MLYSYLILNCLVGFLNTLGYLAALYAGTQFDPKLAEILLKLIESGKVHPASI